MKKLFVAVAAFLFAFAAQAQQTWLAYTMTDMQNGVVLPVYMSYRVNGGYEMMINGRRGSVDITLTEAVVNLGKLRLRIFIDGKYWHDRPGQWRTASVTSNVGDAGIHRMYYVGMEPNGRRYIEEIWLNGKLFNRSETVIDHNDHIVWSIATDSEGTLRLERVASIR